MRAAATLLLALAAPVAAGPLMPPDAGRTIGARIPFDGLVDETGAPAADAPARRPEATDERPWIVSPIYTRCPHTCSAITSGLQSALRESGLDETEYRVVSFSFDPTETGESLLAFRRRLKLPAGWRTLRAADQGALTRLLDALDFRTMRTADGEYQHPNLVAILTPDRRLAGYVLGVRPSPAELARLVRRARDGLPRGGGGRLLVFFFAAVGFLLSAFVFTWLLLERRSRAAEATRA